MAGGVEGSIFLFDTTTHAMWGEEVARERAIPAEVIPAPPASGAKCDLALRTLPARCRELSGAFDEEGIEYRIFGA